MRWKSALLSSEAGPEKPAESAQPVVHWRLAAGISGCSQAILVHYTDQGHQFQRSQGS